MFLFDCPICTQKRKITLLFLQLETLLESLETILETFPLIMLAVSSLPAEYLKQ